MPVAPPSSRGDEAADSGPVPSSLQEGHIPGDSAMSHGSPDTASGGSPLKCGAGPGQAADPVVCPCWPRSFTRLAILATAVVSIGGCASWSEYINNGFAQGPNFSKPPATVAEARVDGD